MNLETNTMDIKLQKNLKRLMKAQKIGLKELAAELDLSASTVHGWLNGVTPKSLQEIKRLAIHLGVSLDELCFGEEIQNSKIETDIHISFGDSSYKVIFLKFDNKRGIL
jgi:transcriptional regulator with XRE-family HTH domain